MAVYKSNKWQERYILHSQKNPAWWIENILGDKLWDKQVEICDAIVSHERVAVPASFGIGKCVEKNALIPLTTGEVVSAGELEGKKFQVVAFTESKEQVSADAFAEDNGIKCVHEITFMSGNKITRTGNHPLYTLRAGFLPVVELQQGDFVAAPKRFLAEERITNPEFLEALVRIKTSPFAMHLNDMFVWDRVEQVRHAGKKPTTAICVPGHETFITTVVEHNTYLAARICLWYLYCFNPSRVISCYDEETRVLTETRGFQYFRDLVAEDRVATLDKGFLTYEKPLQHYRMPFKGDMLAYQDDYIDFCVTPNHRCWTTPPGEVAFEIKTAENIYGQSVSFSRHAAWAGTPDELYASFYEFMGFCLLAGTPRRSTYTGKIADITFPRTINSAYIAYLFSGVPGGIRNCTVSYRELRRQQTAVHGEWGYKVGDPSLQLVGDFYDKKGTPVIPDWLGEATGLKLRAFVKGCIAAFSTTIGNEPPYLTVFFPNKALAEAVLVLAYKAAMPGTLQQVVPSVDGEKRPLFRQTGALWAIRFHENTISYPEAAPDNWRKVPYDGMVSCVKTRSGIVLVERNGKIHWSGNTAPNQRQVKSLLWSELRTAHAQSKVPLGGRPNILELNLGPNHFAIGFSSSDTNIDAFTGHHEANQLVVFDQAAGVSSVHWKGAEGLMTGANCRWLAISNTAIADCEIANICLPERKSRHGEWKVIRIKAGDSPNVQAGRDIIPGLVKHDWVERKKREWGTQDPLYRIFVEAEFVPESEMRVIPYDVMNRMFDTEGELGDDLELGIDIATTGTDSTVWFLRSGSKGLEVQRTTGQDTQKLARMTEVLIRDWEKKYEKTVVKIKIDVTGVGQGVADALIDRSWPVVPFIAGARNPVIDKERYSNVRAECAWVFRDHASIGLVGLANLHAEYDEILEYLRSDIRVTRYQITSSGRIQLVKKDEIRKEIGRSPDYWDAMVMAFEEPGGGDATIEYIPAGAEGLSKTSLDDPFFEDKEREKAMLEAFEKEHQGVPAEYDEWARLTGQVFDFNDPGFY